MTALDESHQKLRSSRRKPGPRTVQPDSLHPDLWTALGPGLRRGDRVGGASLFVGHTHHCRFAPRRHSFSYSVFQLLVDIDHPTEAVAGLRTFQAGLFSFDPKDHGARDGSSLRTWVEAKLVEADLPAEAAHIDLLCFPRVLGFVFNPLSIFFIYDHDRRLEAVIYEVNNTFGQTHAYVVPASGAPTETHTADKRLYVSPFYKVEGGYSFRLTPPGETFHLSIVKQVGDVPDFTATLTLRREPLTDARLLKLFFAMPLTTLKVVAAIHWEALRLWLKGAPFSARPPGPKTGMSVGRATDPSL